MSRNRALLVYIVFALVFIVAFFTLPGIQIRPSVVYYYERVMSEQQLDAITDTAYCTHLRLPGGAMLVRNLLGEPAFRCFDTLAELNAWMAN